MSRIFSLILCVAMCSAAAANEQVTTFKLENGLEAVVVEDHRAPVVVHMLYYRAGAADEPAGTSGIAHFLEHLLFKATENMESGEFSRVVKANGGSDNAATSWDYTTYYQRIAADRLGLMMQMEADRMRHLQLTEEDIATERDVILEERNQRTDSDPGALFGEQRRAAQFLNHPYGIPVIGWRHEMEELDMDDALAFYRKYYAPNNAILVVAGDVDPEEVKALAQKYYGPLEPTPGLGPRVRPQEPPQLVERRLNFSDPRVAQPYVIRTYLAPERDAGDQKEAAALTMLSWILGGSSTTSVLGRALEHETDRAVYTASFYDGTSYDDTTFTVIIVPTPEYTLAEAERELDKEIAKFLEDGVDADQLTRLKGQIRAETIYQRDDVSEIAREYGAALTAGLTVEDVQAWPDLLQQVTAEEIMDAARKIFQRCNAVTGFFDKPAQVEGEEK